MHHQFPSELSCDCMYTQNDCIQARKVVTDECITLITMFRVNLQLLSQIIVSINLKKKCQHFLRAILKCKDDFLGHN